MKRLIKPAWTFLLITLLVTSCAMLTACELMTAAEQPAGAETTVTPVKPSVSSEKIPELNNKLLAAVHTGSHNEKQVIALLDQGADVDVKDRYGRTVLMKAVGKNKIKIARALLERGADVKAKDEMGNTAMKRAEEIGNEAMINLLKEFGG
jgi:hypothetical protein